MNNAGAKVLFGGTSDRDDLVWWTTLAGERDERVTTTDEHGRASSHSVRKVPVIAAPQLARLADHQVVVFAPGLPPAIGWAERYWRRADVRAVQQPKLAACPGPGAQLPRSGRLRWVVWRGRFPPVHDR